MEKPASAERSNGRLDAVAFTADDLDLDLAIQAARIRRWDPAVANRQSAPHVIGATKLNTYPSGPSSWYEGSCKGGKKNVVVRRHVTKMTVEETYHHLELNRPASSSALCKIWDGACIRLHPHSNAPVWVGPPTVGGLLVLGHLGRVRASRHG